MTLRRQRLAVWMDDECRQLRRKSRLLERRYGRSDLADDRKSWVEHERLRQQVYREIKGASLLVSAGECSGEAAATTLAVVEYINGC